MTNKLDPEKYNKDLRKLGMEAKAAIIDLLKAQDDRCFVVVNEFEDYIWNEENWLLYRAVGLDEDGGLVIAGTKVYDPDSGYTGDYYPDFDGQAEYLPEFNYPQLYQFVASNLNKAVTRKEAAELVNHYEEEEYDDE